MSPDRRLSKSKIKDFFYKIILRRKIFNTRIIFVHINTNCVLCNAYELHDIMVVIIRTTNNKASRTQGFFCNWCLKTIYILYLRIPYILGMVDKCSSQRGDKYLKIRRILSLFHLFLLFLLIFFNSLLLHGQAVAGSISHLQFWTCINLRFLYYYYQLCY